MKVLMVLTVAICLWLASVTSVGSDEMFIVDCENVLQLDKRLSIRLDQIQEMINSDKADKMWHAIFSVEIYALLDTKATMTVWFNENCSVS